MRSSGDPEKGKDDLTVIALVVVGCLLVLGLWRWLWGGELVLVSAFGRPLIAVALVALVFEGREWAKNVLAAWAGWGGIGVVLVAAGAGRSALSLLPLIVLGIVLFACAFFLFTSDHIEAFMKTREIAGRGPRPPAAS